MSTIECNEPLAIDERAQQEWHYVFTTVLAALSHRVRARAFFSPHTLHTNARAFVLLRGVGPFTGRHNEARTSPARQAAGGRRTLGLLQ